MSGRGKNAKSTTYMGVNIPSELAKAVKIEAVKEDRTIQAWLTSLIEKELSRRGVLPKG